MPKEAKRWILQWTVDGARLKSAQVKTKEAERTMRAWAVVAKPELKAGELPKKVVAESSEKRGGEPQKFEEASGSKEAGEE